MCHKCCTKMKLRFVFDRRHRATNKKEAPVELEIYFKRNSTKIIPTGVKLLKNQWNDMVVNHPEASKLNKELYEIKKEYSDKLHVMETEGIELDLENFNERNKNKENAPSNFLEFMYDEISKRPMRDSTKRQHLIAFGALMRFKKIQSFSSLTLKNIEDFDNFLRNERSDRRQTTIHGYHKRIKPYVSKAFKYGYIEVDPYRHFDDVKGKSKERIPLMQDELDKLMNVELEQKLDKVRDMFIFSCYTGLSFIDMIKFNYEKEVVESNGMKFIDGHRFKTGTEFYTPILPPAMKVLEKYHLKLPRISNQKYNDYLHIIEARLGLNKPLTSHVARHTFATTVALAHDVPIESVSKMLGHKDIKTTQIYAKVLKSTIERNVMQKML